MSPKLEIQRETYQPRFEVLEPPKKPAVTKKRIAALGITAALFAQNVDTIVQGYSYGFLGGHMAPRVAGCEYEPPETTIAPTTTIDTETTTTTTLPAPTTTNPTAAAEIVAEKETSTIKNNSPLQMTKNIPTFLLQNHAKYDHFEHSFFSKHSSIKYEIYHTGEKPERTINYDVLDDVLHLAFTTDIEHASDRIEAVTDCVSQKVLKEKVLAGNTVKILIPSTNDYCISNLLLVRVNDRKNNTCTQSGAATPKIELEVLMFKPFSEQIFYVTAGDLNADSPDELNAKFADLLMHENTHRIYYDLGVIPRNHPDERMVEYHELTAKIAESVVAPHGPPAPSSFGFARARGIGSHDKKLAVQYTTVD